jgi:transposase
LGHEVIVADPNFAPMYARSRKVKTDERDARALCDACHLGAYRPAHRSSDASRLLRERLAARTVLVQTRSRSRSLCRVVPFTFQTGAGQRIAFDEIVLGMSEDDLGSKTTAMRSRNQAQKSATFTPH